MNPNIPNTRHRHTHAPAPTAHTRHECAGGTVRRNRPTGATALQEPHQHQRTKPLMQSYRFQPVWAEKEEALALSVQCRHNAGISGAGIMRTARTPLQSHSLGGVDHTAMP